MAYFLALVEISMAEILNSISDGEKPVPLLVILMQSLVQNAIFHLSSHLADLFIIFLVVWISEL